MIRDRMPDLCAQRRNSFLQRSNSFLQDMQIQIRQDKKLNQVLEDAGEIRDLIQLLVENIAKVKEMQNNVLTHTDKSIQVELDNRIFTISQTAKRVQGKLTEMGKQTTKIDDLTVESAAEGPAHERVKILQYTTMLKLYSETIQDYNESLLRYHEKCTSLLHQQRLLTRRQITSAELDEMIDAQETSLFVDNILADIQLTKQQLSDIQTRHSEVKKLEKSITEIRDVFLNIGFLIQEQVILFSLISYLHKKKVKMIIDFKFKGEQINCVEYFAGKTVDNIDSGGQDLKIAKRKSKRLRKRKIQLAVILAVIFLILIIIAIYF
ncbi:syntaxin-1A-like isoform X2 [Belonocnema kinseyi]|uniref:syntaxin-1A-like isoform X2 n=1 Tax=Belonocnema kinseyi TaxID=2817044 RepID=UPI00143D9861|nr:syntaxin-1A-like isoform X2 [Belonocnema kinseyi]